MLNVFTSALKFIHASLTTTCLRVTSHLYFIPGSLRSSVGGCLDTPKSHTQAEKRRKEATASAIAVTKALVGNVNNRVSMAYANEKRLDTEARQLQANAAQFAKQSMQWLSLIENFNTALKELGDVENWAKSIEVDMHTISSAMEYALKDT